MNPHQIIKKFYDHLSSKITNKVIPVSLRPPTLVSTVQDDPFDSWVTSEIKRTLKNIEVHPSGKLTTPDIILRHKASNSLLGIEVKKLIQQPDGKDPRGLTIDYNSCLPCGRTLVKVGTDTVDIPCYYFFALLNHDSSSMTTSILIDGDFFNYDFDLHKRAKYANQSEYNHGPYGEGSVRHRRMYTYPNPLNYKLSFFRQRHILVLKKQTLSLLPIEKIYWSDMIVRSDKYNNSFHYVIIDNSQRKKQFLPVNKRPVQQDIFKKCKERKPKERTAAVPRIPE